MRLCPVLLLHFRAESATGFVHYEAPYVICSEGVFMLDEEARKRIEAEEAYRAQVRVQYGKEAIEEQYKPKRAKFHFVTSPSKPRNEWPNHPVSQWLLGAWLLLTFSVGLLKGSILDGLLNVFLVYVLFYLIRQIVVVLPYNLRKKKRI